MQKLHDETYKKYTAIYKDPYNNLDIKQMLINICMSSCSGDPMTCQNNCIMKAENDLYDDSENGNYLRVKLINEVLKDYTNKLDSIKRIINIKRSESFISSPCSVIPLIISVLRVIILILFIMIFYKLFSLTSFNSSSLFLIY